MSIHDFEAHGIPKRLAEAADAHITKGLDDIEQRTLICARVADVAAPHVASAIRNCHDCNAEVWVDQKMLPAADKAERINCIPCVEKREGKSIHAIVMDALNGDNQEEL